MGNKMLGTVENVNVEAERLLEAEETGIVPSWGIVRLGWGMETMMAVITKLETVTGIELKEGSKLRPSLQKICFCFCVCSKASGCSSCPCLSAAVCCSAR